MCLFNVILKFPQILTDLSDLGTTTMGVAHSVWVTGYITPLFIKLLSSFSTAGRNEKGTLCGLQNTGVTLSLSTNSTSTFLIYPNAPSNTLEYFLFNSSTLALVVFVTVLPFSS